MDSYEKAARLIADSKYTVILTGAGISTESGIPDFRSPGSGLWEKHDPIEMLSTQVLYNNPTKFYKEGFKLLLSMKNAEPNKAHYLINELCEAGFINAIITQNIDNLHQKASSTNVYEVHGDTRYCRCLSCEKVFAIELIERKIEHNEIPPRCTCGGILRPNVVLFGDMLPKCFDTAMRAVEDADLLIVAGSSLTVSPVNYAAGICKKLIILNIGETPFDFKASIVIRDKISESLKKISDNIKKIAGD